MKKLEKVLISTLVIVASALFFYSKQSSAASFSPFYFIDEKGLHLKATGTTESGKKWTLREYLPGDLEGHFEIIHANTNNGDSKDPKLYRDLPTVSKESIQKRRALSLIRFAKGMPWGHMSLLNEEGKCVLVFGLIRSGELILSGHGDIGLTPDPKEEHNGYRLSLLKFLTQELAPEIKRLGESGEVADIHFAEDVDDAGSHMNVGPLTYIDITCSPEQERLWKELLETGFVFYQKDAIDWREKTQRLRSSSFKTLEKDFLELVKETEENLVERQRYLITGPGGKEIVVWNSPKWGGIKLCFTYEVPNKK